MELEHRLSVTRIESKTAEVGELYLDILVDNSDFRALKSEGDYYTAPLGFLNKGDTIKCIITPTTSLVACNTETTYAEGTTVNGVHAIVSEETEFEFTEQWGREFVIVSADQNGISNFQYEITRHDKATIEEPVGFDNLQMSIKRNDYHGICAESSVGNLEFYGAAADLITEIYEDNIETEILYEIEGDGVLLQWLIDLSTYSLNESEYSRVSCKVCETGVKTMFNNRTQTDIDLNEPTTVDGKKLDHPAWIKLGIPSKHLTYTNLSKRTADTKYTTSGGRNTYPDTGIAFHNEAPYIFIPIGDNIKEEFGSLQEQEPYGTDDTNNISPQYISASDHESQFGTGTVAKLEIELHATIERTSGGWAPCHDDSIIWYLEAVDANGTTYRGIRNSIPKSEVNFKGATWDIDCSLTASLNADTSIKYYLVMYPQLGTASAQYFWAHMTIKKGSFVRMTMIDNLPSETTDTDMLPVGDALNTVIQAIGEKKVTFLSDWYTSLGGGAQKAITNGYKMRELYTDEFNMRNMPISFRKLIENLDAMDCIGWGFSPQDGSACVRVELWTWFYQFNTILVIADAKEITTNAIADRMISQLKIGYKKHATKEQYNAIDSPHGSRTFTNGSKVVDKPLEKLSEFIADNYAIEEVRRYRKNKSEMEESSYDESIFIFELVKRTNANNGIDMGYFIEPTIVQSSAEGVGDPATFLNAKLTPRHMASRWRDYLFATSGKSNFRFISGEINYSSIFSVIASFSLSTYQGTRTNTYSLQTKNEKSPQAENDDITYTPSLLKAEEIKFKYPITLSQYQSIKKNPYGLINVNGKRGWIKEIKYSFADGTAEFTLIAKY